jgi:hypothetical protein
VDARQVVLPEADALTQQVASVEALILVDYDNLFPAGHAGVEPSALRHALLEAITHALDLAPHVGFVRIRLYGGWTDAAGLTSAASRVLTAVGLADPFPCILPGGRAVLHGTIGLATSLIELPGMDFAETYRTRLGPPRLRVNGSPHPDGCVADSTSCPALLLKRFTKGPGRTCPAPSCDVTSAMAFAVHEQKMVDTLMACDLIAAAEAADVAVVLVATGDTDLLPPILMAARRAFGSVTVFTQTPSWRPEHAAVFKASGVSLYPGELVDESS